MTLYEERRMKLLEEALREVRRIAREAKEDSLSIPLEDALHGDLAKAWKNVKYQINLLLP